MNENCVNDYFKTLKETYPFFLLVEWTIFIVCAILIFDISDIFSLMISKHPSITCVLCIGIIFFILVQWLSLHHYDFLFKEKFITIYDASAIVTLMASIIILCIELNFFEVALYKIVLLSISTAIAFIFILWRIWVLSQKINESSSINPLHDLGQLYQDDIPYSKKSTPYDLSIPILFLEKDVSYDLLNRENVINQLYNSILNCNNHESFVISLEGPWGSGKTTILNNVKSKLKNRKQSSTLYIIDDFDPWLFGNQESLLLAMYDTILKHAGVKYDALKNAKVLTGLSNVLSQDLSSMGAIPNIFSTAISCSMFNSVGKIPQIKQRIGKYLDVNNAKIIFFIDNLDRAEDQNVVFLFKLFGMIFDIPRITYVLSFDRDRVNRILNNSCEIDRNFSEKIINQEIHVPPINFEHTADIYSTCLSNLLKLYDVPSSQINEFQEIVNFIVGYTPDLRQFKRLLNSVFPAVFCNGNNLNKRDLLGLEIIHFFNPVLYLKILLNSDFFISYDIPATTSSYTGFDSEKLNQSGKIFFNDLLVKFPEYKNLLAMLFPYVQHHINGQELQNPFSSEVHESRSVFQQARICSGRYFFLYFSYGENAELRTRKDVQAFILEINKANPDGIDFLVESSVKGMFKQSHNAWIEHFKAHLSTIDSSKTYYVAIAFWKHIYLFGDIATSIFSNSRPYLLKTISDMLKNFSAKEFNDFLEFIDNDYSKIELMRELNHWLEEAEKDSPWDSHMSPALYQVLARIVQQIFNSKINLYSEKYYAQYNILGLIHFSKEIEYIQHVREYINSIIDISNIYRVLYDFISCSFGSEVSYYIDSKVWDKWLETETIEKMINSARPKTESEQFVLDVYKASKNGEPDFWGNRSISRPSEQIIKL